MNTYFCLIPQNDLPNLPNLNITFGETTSFSISPEKYLQVVFFIKHNKISLNIKTMNINM